MDASDNRVSTVELFFDIVFVFTITQLTSLLAEDPTALGVARMILVFDNVCWMYGGYAWLTNAVPPREPGVRLLMVLGMAGFLVVALAIPRAFDANGVAFGVGYLLVNLVHTGMFLRSSEGSTVRAMARLGPFNTITAVLLLVAGFTQIVLGLGPVRLRLTLAGLAAVAGMVGLTTSAQAELAVLVAIVGAGAAAESHSSLHGLARRT